MGNPGGKRPVYRYPPRSHASNCPCSRCAQFRSRPPSGGGWGILIPAVIAFLIGFWPFIFWHGCKYGGSGLSACGSGSDWTWSAQTWIACGIWWGVIAIPVTVALVAKGSANRKLPKPPPPPPELKVPRRFGFAVTDAPKRPLPPTPYDTPPSPPPIQAPPVCVHGATVPVDLGTGERVAWWCPDCDTQLGPEFIPPRRTCCGTPSGTPHLWNCPEADRKVTATRAHAWVPAERELIQAEIERELIQAEIKSAQERKARIMASDSEPYAAARIESIDAQIARFTERLAELDRLDRPYG